VRSNQGGADDEEYPLRVTLREATEAQSRHSKRKGSFSNANDHKSQRFRSGPEL
jgi:hypothetical protein